jgi:hypothetical protein
VDMREDDPQHRVEAEQQARDAWEQLPKGVPSRGALPPAGGGLGAFFGLFVGFWGRLTGKHEQKHHSEDNREE